jgi:hypothetical protein
MIPPFFVFLLCQSAATRFYILNTVLYSKQSVITRYKKHVKQYFYRAVKLPEEEEKKEKELDNVPLYG